MEHEELNSRHEHWMRVGTTWLDILVCEKPGAKILSICLCNTPLKSPFHFHIWFRYHKYPRASLEISLLLERSEPATIYSWNLVVWILFTRKHLSYGNFVVSMWHYWRVQRRLSLCTVEGSSSSSAHMEQKTLKMLGFASLHLHKESGFFQVSFLRSILSTFSLRHAASYSVVLITQSTNFPRTMIRIREW